jgi:K+-transporting ATPase ATPase C chain
LTIRNYGPSVRLAIISLVLCGLFFPLLITGLAQVVLPSQANGSIVMLHGRPVGSILVAQSFDSPMLFHADWTNRSASGVDPDITLQDAYSQIPRISNATGIASDLLAQIVNEHVERTLWVTGDAYVNVLKLNLVLIQEYPAIYRSFN